VNVPLSAGADDAVYLAAFERIVAPILNQYDPDLVLISAGFDAHYRDPLASMRVTDAGYAGMLGRVKRALPRPVTGRLGLVLEGGYDLDGLSGSLKATLEALDGSAQTPENSAEVAGLLAPEHEIDLKRALSALRPFWKL
jgi:acetoin utilization deacetylase AcuC-like enzyme